MKADLTRNTFDPLNRYSAVLMQQGRVQLDADWNEQHAIVLYYLRRLGADLIGPHGGPDATCGFAIAPILLGSEQTGDFRIGAGRYYVDGILCELGSASLTLTERASNGGQLTVQVPALTLDGLTFRVDQFVEVFDGGVVPTSPPFPPTIARISSVDPTHRLLTLQGAFSGPTAPSMPKLRRVVSYRSQGDYTVPAASQLPEGVHQVYLDVWERHISYIEDDSMREVALGGPDTAARTKVVWQVKIAPPCRRADGSSPTCCTADELAARLNPASPARLKARARRAMAATDPCIVRPDARYRGAENQLYRVEIHTGGVIGSPTPPTFKWSRDNGSAAFPIVSGGGSAILTLETIGRDDRVGLRAGDWVEVGTDDSALHNLANPLLQVEAVDRIAMTVTLSGPAPVFEAEGAGHPLLRRWDHQEGDHGENGLDIVDDGAARIVEHTAAWLHLEDGVEIQFQPADAGTAPTEYRTGDYWLIPARTATGDVEWPTEQDATGQAVPLALPPDGIVHHYAPLAVITVDAAGNVQDGPTDCRHQFPPLA
ncbi:DUF6519 domain-containing protein [Pseudoduganella sp. HUAS MS19]